MIRAVAASGVSYLATSASLAAALTVNGIWKYPLFAPLGLVVLTWAGTIVVSRSR